MHPELLLHDFKDEKGLGVIAGAPIAINTFICRYTGPLLTYNDALRVEEQHERNGAGCYMYFFRHPRTGVKMCIDGTFYELLPYEQVTLDQAYAYLPKTGFSRYLNHSRKGNLSIKAELDEKDEPVLNFYARHDIDEGAELLYDYGDRRQDVLEAFKWLKQ